MSSEMLTLLEKEVQLPVARPLDDCKEQAVSLFAFCQQKVYYVTYAVDGSGKVSNDRRLGYFYVFERFTGHNCLYGF